MLHNAWMDKHEVHDIVYIQSNVMRDECCYWCGHGL